MSDWASNKEDKMLFENWRSYLAEQEAAFKRIAIFKVVNDLAKDEKISNQQARILLNTFIPNVLISAKADEKNKAEMDLAPLQIKPENQKDVQKALSDLFKGSGRDVEVYYGEETGQQADQQQAQDQQLSPDDIKSLIEKVMTAENKEDWLTAYYALTKATNRWKDITKVDKTINSHDDYMKKVIAGTREIDKSVQKHGADDRIINVIKDHAQNVVGISNFDQNPGPRDRLIDIIVKAASKESTPVDVEEESEEFEYNAMYKNNFESNDLQIYLNEYVKKTGIERELAKKHLEMFADLFFRSSAMFSGGNKYTGVQARKRRREGGAEAGYTRLQREALFAADLPQTETAVEEYEKFFDNEEMVKLVMNSGKKKLISRLNQYFSAKGPKYFKGFLKAYQTGLPSSVYPYRPGKKDEKK